MNKLSLILLVLGAVFLISFGILLVFTDIIDTKLNLVKQNVNNSSNDYLYQAGGYVNISRDKEFIEHIYNNGYGLEVNPTKTIIINKPCFPEQGVRQVFSNGQIVADAKVGCKDGKLTVELNKDIDESTLQVGIL